jgi:hypothetical protein
MGGRTVEGRGPQSPSLVQKYGVRPDNFSADAYCRYSSDT